MDNKEIPVRVTKYSSRCTNASAESEGYAIVLRKTRSTIELLYTPRKYCFFDGCTDSHYWEPAPNTTRAITLSLRASYSQPRGQPREYSDTIYNGPNNSQYFVHPL